jgi:hypothetical protein
MKIKSEVSVITKCNLVFLGNQLFRQASRNKKWRGFVMQAIKNLSIFICKHYKQDATQDG